MFVRPADRFRPRLARLDDRTVPAVVGGPDPTFGTAGLTTLDLGGTADKYAGVAVQFDGSAVAAGTNGGDFVVTRFLPNGKVDTSYGTNGTVAIDFGGADEANAVLLDAAGRAVVVGRSGTGAGGSDFAVARLTTAGALDAAFGTGGKRTVDFVGGADAAFAATIDGAGRILVGGSSGTQFAATRLTPDGTVDTSFGLNGLRVVPFDAPSEVRAVFVVPSSNRVILAGTTTRSGKADGINNDFVAVRLDPNGAALDKDFGNKVVSVGATVFTALAIDFGGTDQMFAGTPDPNGRFLVAGSTSVGADFAAARFDSNGNLDATFGTGGKVTVDFGGTDAARGIYDQPDGRIVLGGYAAANTTVFAAARLTTAGALDTTFAKTGKGTLPGTGTLKAYAAAPASDGGVTLVGSTGGAATDGAAGRLAGMVGSPGLLLASGTTDGAVKQFVPANGSYQASAAFAPFPGVASATRAAVGDVNGDGVPDRVAVTGPGVAPLVVLYDGKTGGLLANQLAFEGSFTGGLFVAVGDANNDGFADVVVTPDQSGGPRVRVLDGKAFAANQVAPLADFYAIDDPNFRGGVRPAVADVNADGYADLVVSAGFGGGPRIALWSGQTLAPGGTPARLVPDFFAFEETLRDGAYVAAGDINGDGNADLVFGGGPNGGPRVRVASGAALLATGGFASLDQVPGAQIANFFAGDPNSRGGVRVAVRDVDGDAFADLTTGSGQNLASQILVFKGTTLIAGGSPSPDQTLDPFGAVLASGVFVG